MSTASYVELRALGEARYIVEHKATVREACKEFGVTKSTTHRDMNIVLPRVDYALYTEVMDIFGQHIEERASRGGKAVQKKKKLDKQKQNSMYYTTWDKTEANQA